jgi:hypothetical protein
VRDASGDWALDLDLDDLSSLGCSDAGVGVVGFKGRDVKARGALMADMTPPNAE